MIRKQRTLEASRRVAMMLVTVIAFVSLVQLSAGSAKDHAISRPSDSQEFQGAFDKYVHDDSIVGAAYVLVKDGQAREWHGVGTADREVNQAVDQNTIFHWGSITKTLTAVAVMQLRDQHRISLDDSITKYVPELNRIHSDYGPVSQVTLKQLLSHSAGFQGPTWPYREDDKPWQPFEPTEWAQLVAMMPYQELGFKPGSKFSYSNPAFIYLARVIEKVSGLPYQTYVQRNILIPLGMTHTYFNLTPTSLAKDRSNNYSVFVDTSGKETIKANGREFDTGITTPNGGLNAPLGDLVRWVAFLTGRNSPATRPLLARATLEEMWRPVVVMSATAERPESMGLSFFLAPRNGSSGSVTFIGHTGSQAGFRAFLEFNPLNGTGIIAAFNTSHEFGHNETENSSAIKSRDGFNALREQSFSLLK
ncbi:MAG TPA: serine hydrolase domain-containing protein [Pyrinomonadaceae bacterium]|nr:serine hydrolase domain-containing protein [Pyrinomonadaceae bacterium]